MPGGATLPSEASTDLHYSMHPATQRSGRGASSRGLRVQYRRHGLFAEPTFVLPSVRDGDASPLLTAAANCFDARSRRRSSA